MGSAIAGRLRAAGHRVALYDPALPEGESASSLADAARHSVITFLCLPDAGVVEASLSDLQRAAPPIVVDLTSSVPSTTRRVAAALAPLGVDVLDCPVSGGVAGARSGTLTAMVGGDRDVLERVRPVVSSFASNVRWAGPLGSGHATKALNNVLSAASLTATAEMLVTAVACGAEEASVVDRFNAGPARSQNSEVKYPRDVLTRTYGAGFTASLMVKDVGVALRMAEERGVPAPFLAGVLETWRDVAEAVGGEADFTRVHALVEARRSGGDGSAVGGSDVDGAVGALVSALASTNLLAASEALRVAEAEGLDRERVLAIVNTSSGRSEATRSGLAGELDVTAIAAAADLTRRAGVWAPLTTLAAALVG